MQLVDNYVDSTPNVPVHRPQKIRQDQYVTAQHVLTIKRAAYGVVTTWSVALVNTARNVKCASCNQQLYMCLNSLFDILVMQNERSQYGAWQGYTYAVAGLHVSMRLTVHSRI